MKLKFFFSLALLLTLGVISSQVYIGTTEGYIYNTEGQKVSGASVTVSVNNCNFADGCNEVATSESTGYYVVANLILPKNGPLKVSAQKMTPLGLESGSASDVANQYQAAYVDVIMCLPPPNPSLVEEPNTNNPLATLEWTSSPDKKGYAVYDEFKLDSTPNVKSVNAGSKSMDVTNLAYKEHKWQVRTCNPYCCSNWISNTFSVGNTKPSKPTLTPQPDITPHPVTLQWTSGTDPEGDETFDEYQFGIDDDPNQKTITDVSSPQTEETFSCNFYSWQVRTCEKESQKLCSDWAEDGFIACGNPCPQCGEFITLAADISGYHEERGFRTQTLTVRTPPTIEQGLDLPLDIRYTSVNNNHDALFKISSNEFNFNDFMIPVVVNNTARFEMIGIQKNNIKPGTYSMTLDVFANDRQYFSETFEIIVTKPLLIRIIKNLAKQYWWLILFLFILAFTGYLIYKNMQKKYLKPKSVDKKISKRPAPNV